MGRQVVGFSHEFYKFYYFRSGSIDRANSIYSYEEKNKKNFFANFRNCIIIRDSIIIKLIYFYYEEKNNVRRMEKHRG